MPALSVMLIAAERAPVAKGLKVTLKLHPVPAASVAAQLLLPIVKSEALAPEGGATVIPVTVEAVVFSSPTDWLLLLVDTTWMLKERPAGDNCIAGGAVAPLPFTVTTCGLPVALLVMVKVELSVVVTVGFK